MPLRRGRGLIHNGGGQVQTARASRYPADAVGWIKRGPSGVIGTNKEDAQGTVDGLFEDLGAEDVPEGQLASGSVSIEALLDEAKPDHITFERWQAIDAARSSEATRTGARG